MLNLFRSLLLSTLLSFFSPVILLGGLLFLLHAAGYIPGFAPMSQAGMVHLWEFLAVFGGGCPLQGIITIGCTFAFVGSLFDLFNFSLYQGIKTH